MSKRLFYLLALCLFAVACHSQALPDADEPPPVAEHDPGNQPPKSGISSDMLVTGCFGCHGPQGRSEAPAIPSLAGLSKDYFIHTMQAYQYGGRFATVMGRIAMGYEEDEIARMAEYFSGLETQRHTQRIDWRLLNKGRQLHRRYCRDCHGDLDNAAEVNSVSLNGQWKDYLRWTLQDYLIGINQTDGEMSQQLTLLIREHGTEGLESLIEYLSSSRP